MPSMRAALLSLSVACLACGVAFSAEPPAGAKRPRFKPLSNAEAWKRLPREERSLPAWARVLAASLPRTTAGMLELDAVHRTKNPLGPVLRAKIRWVAADANRCEYSRRYAEVDLRRAGWKGEVKQLRDLEGLPGPERAALAFARKMTLAAYTVTDEEVAELVEHYGAEKVVGMVHTLAHANFQDRIFLALGVSVEPGGLLPPLAVRLNPEGKLAVAAPKRPKWEEVRGRKVEVVERGPDWVEKRYAALRETLEKQKGRKPRVPEPDWEKVKGKLPPAARKRGPSRILWTRVSMGYQPVLTRAWFDCMGQFQGEAHLDRVFANSLFWVVTRSNECFY
jgi:alkylhydroperoxidase family enzyme